MQNPLLLVTEHRTRDHIFISRERCRMQSMGASSQYNFHAVCTYKSFSFSHREVRADSNLSSLSPRDVGSTPSIIT
jgi:hypothetical protein